MKLPGIAFQTGVQSLGREDVSGPLRVARANTAAVRAQVRLQEATSAIAMEYHEANATAEYDAAMAEMQTREGKLRNMLTSGPVLDTEATPLPAWMQVPTETVFDAKTGASSERTQRFIPMHEIAEQLYNGNMDRLQEHALQRTKNPLARKQLRKKMPYLRAAGVPKVHKAQVGFFRDQQMALVDVAVEDYVRTGDEGSARTAMTRAFSAGLLTPADYAKRMKSLGERVDKQAYNDMLFNAKTPAELEAVREHIADGTIASPDGKVRVSRLDADEQWQLRGRIETLEKERDQDVDRAHKLQMRARTEETFQQGQQQETGDKTAAELYMEGLLSRSKLLQMIEDEDLDPKRALAYQKLLDSGPPSPQYLKSSPVTLNYYRKRIRSARHLQYSTVPSDGTPRVSERYDEVEASMMAAMVGLDADGAPYNGPLLNSTDYKTLLGELRSEEKSFAASPEYTQAIDQMKAHTGLAGGMFVLDTDKTINALAFNDFKRGLDDYIDRHGAQADVARYVADQREHFSVDDYAGKNFSDFMDVYPMHRAVVPAEEDGKTLSPTELLHSRQLVRGHIATLMQAGAIETEDAYTQLIQLRGEHLPQDFDRYVIVEEMQARQ